MAKDKKYSKNSRKDFLRYMEGNLSDRERNRIERNLMKDPFEEEAMEGLSMIGPEEAGEDLAILDQKVLNRVAKRKTNVWYRVAAVAVVLLAISITFVTVFDDRISLLDRKVSEYEEPVEDEKAEKSDTRADAPSRQEQDMVTPPEPEEIPGPEVIYEPGISEITGTAADEDAEIVPEPEEGAIAIADEEIDLETEEDAITLTEEDIAEEFAMETREVMAAREMETRDNYPGEGQRMISGLVVSGEDRQPLQGVNLMLKGTSSQTVSDISGNFELPVFEDSINTLVANYIGMESKEISITDQSEMQITLQPDQSSLDEVVMVDYQASRKSRQSTAMPSMAASETEGIPALEPTAPSSDEDKFREFVEANMRFPEDSELSRAVVILSFDTGPDGRPRNITVLESPADSFSQEAIRLLNEGPDWEPTETEGDPTRQSTRVRIVFTK